jgi:xanthine/CO dehydrogenase XdhC/CoxF family maturation factor
MRELLRLLDRLAVHDRREGSSDSATFAGVLALLARKSGSGYRSPGARVWIAPGGDTVGLISGGCVEDHVREQALADPRRARSLTIDTSAVEESVFGFGTGCAGVLDVLLEPLDAGSAWFSFLESLRAAPRRVVIATVFRAEGRWADELGRHVWRNGGQDGAAADFATDISEPDLERRVVASLDTAGRSPGEGESGAEYGAARDADGEAEWLVERLEPPPRLWLFGAGADVVPLVDLARGLDWPVVVVAPRRRAEHRTRFPQARGVDVVEVSPREAAARLASLLAPAQRREAALLCTHSFLSDLEYLDALRPLDLAYLGAISSPRRREMLLERVAIEPGRLRAPAGLPLGGSEPEDIALAVVAEIQREIQRRGPPEMNPRREPRDR